MKRIKSLFTFSLLACFVFLFSCKDDEKTKDLPDGESPLVLTTAIDRQVSTRATVDNLWDGGEQVQVSIDGAAAAAFTAAADGTLTSGTLFWQSASITARAWYPAGWTMQANQSAQSGYQAADFIFAPETVITYADRNTTPLTFNHKTAKVAVALVGGNGIDISGAVVSFYGYTTGTASTTTDGTLSGSNNGWVTPLTGIGNTCKALLIPQDMYDVEFVRVTLGGKDYFYTPAAGEANLQAGKSYAYRITVNSDGLTIQSTIIDWDDEIDKDVSAELIGQTPGVPLELDGFRYEIFIDKVEATLKGAATGIGPLGIKADEDATIIHEAVEYQGVIYPVTKWEITDFSIFTNLQIINISASLKRIEDRAFYGCENLREVIFASGSQLESIGKEAFRSCIALEKITIPASIKIIDEFTFVSCFNLLEVFFEEGSQLEEIKFGAFNNSSINRITIPASVKTIGDAAFWTCHYLREVIFAPGTQLEHIGNFAFIECLTLETITIPAKVKEISVQAFDYCANLREIIFAEGTQLEKIGSSAFGNSKLLTTITIPASVKTIDEKAFNNCSKLASVNLLRTTPPQLGENVFASVPDGLWIYVPSASAGAYNSALQNGTYGWINSGVGNSLTAGGMTTVVGLTGLSEPPVITISATL